MSNLAPTGTFLLQTESDLLHQQHRVECNATFTSDSAIYSVHVFLCARYWGVFIYKSVFDLSVTKVQPGDVNFMGRIIFSGSNLFIVHFACIKNFPFNFFLLLLKETKGKTEQIKRIVFCVCKINNKVI